MQMAARHLAGSITVSSTPGLRHKKSSPLRRGSERGQSYNYDSWLTWARILFANSAAAWGWTRRWLRAAFAKVLHLVFHLLDCRLARALASSTSGRVAAKGILIAVQD